MRFPERRVQGAENELPGCLGKIKATEEALGKALLVKNQGGRAGGGSTLTPYARALMERYQELSRIVEKQADDLFGSGFAELIRD